MFLHVLTAVALFAVPRPAWVSAAQVVLNSTPEQAAFQPISAAPVDALPAWPAGRYFRVDFAGMASDTIVVNGYRANVIMLDNSATAGAHFAVARLPEDAAVTTGFITFMVAAKTALGYTSAVPLKIVLDDR